MSNYFAYASWNGRFWEVEVRDRDDQQLATATAERLADVQQNASAMLATRFGCLPEQLRLSVEVALPAPVSPFVDTAERHTALASTSLRTAIEVLKHYAMPTEDINAVLSMRALTVTAARPTTAGR